MSSDYIVSYLRLNLIYDIENEEKNVDLFLILNKLKFLIFVKCLFRDLKKGELYNVF